MPFSGRLEPELLGEVRRGVVIRLVEHFLRVRVLFRRTSSKAMDRVCGHTRG